MVSRRPAEPNAPIVGEEILRTPRREIRILVASADVTITEATYAAGERVAAPHVHDEHTDAFYVLDGELTFEIGSEATAIAVSSGGFVSVPPGVAHSVENAGDRPARWLTIHARDGGFAAFVRGIRDGVAVEWDIAAVAPDDGLPASDAVIRHGLRRCAEMSLSAKSDPRKATVPRARRRPRR